MERDKLKTDLVALFLDRLPPMSHEDSDQMIEECNEDLEVIEPFVLVGGTFLIIEHLLNRRLGKQEICPITEGGVWYLLHHGLLCFPVPIFCD